MAKKSYFLKESEKQSAGQPANQQSSAMLALFQPKTEGGADIEGLNLSRRNMPQIVKAVDRNGVNIPVGGTVTGIIVDVMASQKEEIKGSLLWLHLVKVDGKKVVPTGQEICFPACGSIRQALAPNAKGKDKEKEDSAREEMLKLKGHLIACKRCPDKVNSKYNKNMGIWEVFTSEKPVDVGIKIH